MQDWQKAECDSQHLESSASTGQPCVHYTSALDTGQLQVRVPTIESGASVSVSTRVLL